MSTQAPQPQHWRKILDYLQAYANCIEDVDDPELEQINLFGNHDSARVVLEPHKPWPTSTWPVPNFEETEGPEARYRTSGARYGLIVRQLACVMLEDMENLGHRKMSEKMKKLKRVGVLDLQTEHYSRSWDPETCFRF